jgi:hypothetical protein
LLDGKADRKIWRSHRIPREHVTFSMLVCTLHMGYDMSLH